MSCSRPDKIVAASHNHMRYVPFPLKPSLRHQQAVTRRISFRYLSNKFLNTTRFALPVSSSIVIKQMPPAVPGLCLTNTRPATLTISLLLPFIKSWVEITFSIESFSRKKLTGCAFNESDVAHNPAQHALIETSAGKATSFSYRFSDGWPLNTPIGLSCSEVTSHKASLLSRPIERNASASANFSKVAIEMPASNN